MLYYLIVGMSFSIWIAALAGLVRFKYIDPSYRPFIILCWAGAINEVASFLITRAGFSTNANNNIYLLAESVLLLWQFKKWGPGSWMNRFFWITTVLFVLTWLYEHNNKTSLFEIRYYFRFFYAVVITGLSIQLIQRLVIKHDTGLAKDSRFLTAAGLTIYFTFKILFDAIWLYEFKSSSVAFQQAIYVILASVNFLINLLYALAILWMPKKPHYIIS
jgi:hypothetical protein